MPETIASAEQKIIAPEKPIVWWKDKKLLLGAILIMLSLILGFYSKILFIAKFYDMFYLITGISIYAFSWILLFAGAFLLGRETMKIAQQKINQQLLSTMTKTYHYTKALPRKGIHYTRKGIHYTRRLHKKFKERNKPKKLETLE